MKSKTIISKLNQRDRGEQQQTKTTNQDRATPLRLLLKIGTDGDV